MHARLALHPHQCIAQGKLVDAAAGRRPLLERLVLLVRDVQGLGL